MSSKLFVFWRGLRWAAFALAMTVFAGASLAQVTQTPLLAGQNSAKPNLMVILDNSGSMNFGYAPVRYSATFTATIPTGTALMSSDANRIYYDPRVRYDPPPNADGTLQVAATETTSRLVACPGAILDLATGCGWVQNADSGGTVRDYMFYRMNGADDVYPYGPPVPYTTTTFTVPGQGIVAMQTKTVIDLTTEFSGSIPVNTFTPGYVFTSATFSTTGFNSRIIFLPKETVSKTAVTFTYYVCTTYSGGYCTAVTRYDVPDSASSATYTKYSGRTDCASTSCSWLEERKNVLNWNLYYSTRLKASKAAIAKAFLDPTYDNSFRLGYGHLNTRTGDDDTTGRIDRGVRPFTNNASNPSPRQTEKTDFYTWLYGLTAFGGTPLNGAIYSAGEYFSDGSDTGPYAADPGVVVTSPPAQLACRRNNFILFSDGEANDLPKGVGNTDRTGLINGTISVTVSNVDPATGKTFTYNIAPSSTATYVSYPDSQTNTLSDLAASYWIRDLNKSLTNVITPIIGRNPAFWQHMVTYTIGLAVKSTVSDTQIGAYNANFLKGIASTLTWFISGDAGQSAVNDFAHAAYAGRGKFFSASSAAEINSAFSLILAETANQAGNDAGVAVADTNGSLSTLAGELKYVPSYSTLESSGDLRAYTLDASGTVVDPDAPTWIASNKMPGFGLRKIFTMSGTSTPTDFSTGTFASMPADIRTALGASASDAFVNYLRGQYAVVDPNNGNLFRLRSSNVGTIVNVPPLFVRGQLNLAYAGSPVPGASAYNTFRANKTTKRLGLIMVPSNAGAVHMFDPSTGVEAAAYMPRAAMPKLYEFATDPYRHKYIVDGPLTEHDIYDGSSWRNYAIGTGGRGGAFVYALNIPVPTAVVTTLTVPSMTVTDAKWEIGTSTISDLGLVLNDVQTGYMMNNSWAVVIGNGHDSASGVAKLLVIDALSGSLIKEISTGVGSVASPNALGGVTLVRNADRKVVAAYAGDMLGNMWKFDLSSNATASWNVAFSTQPLYTTPGNKPIFGAPAWREFKGGVLLVAATGVLTKTSHTTDTSVQTIYGVLDKTPVGGTPPVGFTPPLSMSSLQTQTVTTTGNVTNTIGTFYKVSTNSVDWDTQQGWRLDMTLASRQRAIEDVTNFGSAVIVASVAPPESNPAVESCTAGNARTFLYVIEAETGGGKNNFDTNGDGIADAYSVVDAPGFPRGNVVAQDAIGPRTESTVGDTAIDNSGLTGPPCLDGLQSAKVLGTGVKSIGVTAGCTVKAPNWVKARSWRQILNPPLLK